MKFEEQFPTIHSKRLIYSYLQLQEIEMNVIFEQIDGQITKEQSRRFDESAWVPTSALRKHCLDKQKVKDAFKKLCENLNNGKALTEFEKELGLEDD